MSLHTPLVALESTVIAHGLPYPHNLALAQEMEAIVRGRGAEPRTIAVIGGELRAGLSEAELLHLATSTAVRKVSRRDLPIVAARRLDGATTVAATMWVAQRFGISVFATGGIGGVHRGAGDDISADLQELAQTPVIVVCAGAKAILDLPATLEYLETQGVTVVGYGTDVFPAFYSRSSGLAVDVRCDTAAEVAAIWRAKQQLGLPGGLLVTAPIPVEMEIPAVEIEPAITQAVQEAATRGLRSAEVTPFLLTRIAELTGERSLRANLALLRNNAAIAAEIAVAL
ncbi:pseudouridine-5'-phosphate glycosidase [Caldilinea sp.]|uniref:pseudouridine-5'-phosphate glycosidase n=1 Tax=Caldilinea sp. TaxID=2293560 RepID=UPI002C2B0656|nr:pseudouridine-5'-phosphate glycosidase [Anaerolineales bacterium]HQY92267.1 pseudouridine-5'-phosphate glycosidase [Caldilinea sp.]HRA64791.1 pseudouridine-5'-phosphate glycosidase [Caldilinea sp.]